MAPLRRRGACERRSAPSRRRLHDHAGLASRPEEKLTMEIADGIHRIESELGERSMCQYALVGRERVLLIDTGLAETPGEVIDPYLERLAVEPDLVLISHADVDHSGGNRAFRERHPHAVFVCHELDRRWIESNEAMLRENYAWHTPYGFPEPDAAELLR